MTPKKYISYFKDIATKHKGIRHSDTEKRFFRMNIDELLGTGMRSDARFPLMVLENFEGGIYDGDSDNHLKRLEGAFVLLDKVPQGDFNKEADAYERMEKIGIEIFTRMDHDQKMFPKDANSTMIKFEVNSTKWFKVGPIMDSCYGWRFSFSLLDSIDFRYNPEEWL